MLKLDRSDLLAQRHGVRLVLHRGGRREQVEESRRARARLLTGGQHAGEELHRGDQLQHVTGEGQEDTQRDVTLHHQPAA